MNTENSKILIVGGKGFIGTNLTQFYLDDGFDVDSVNTLSEYKHKVKNATHVIYTIGKNRPKHPDEFANDTLTLQEYLKETPHSCRFIYISSVKVTEDKNSEYAICKLNNENKISVSGLPYSIIRANNIIGAGAKPFYNSFISTLLYVKANKLNHTFEHDPEAKISFNHVKELYEIINGENRLPHTMKVSEIIEFIDSFDTELPQLDTEAKKLIHSTYFTYLDMTANIPMERHSDKRGYFSTIHKNSDGTQFAVNVINPRSQKGGHYHHIKVEGFMFLTNNTSLILKDMRTGVEQTIKPVQNSWYLMQPHIKHTIVNDTDSIAYMLIWTNEIYNQNKPDTYYG